MISSWARTIDRLSALSRLSLRLRDDDTDDGVGFEGGMRSRDDYFDEISIYCTSLV
jgi:hypothetical protein